ncbi:MAG: hypothetical protein AAGG50_02525 [Bacteroidota bacterium]
MLRALFAVLLLAALSTVALPTAAAQSLDDAMARLRLLAPPLDGMMAAADGCSAATGDGVWSALALIESEERRQRALSGTARASFASDATENRSLYRLAVGVSLDRGSYPGEINLSAATDVTLQDGTARENVSSLTLSYDHHLSPSFETYAFVKRDTDNFLGIDQRYEIGGGLIGQTYTWDTRRRTALRKRLGNLPAYVTAEGDSARAAAAEALANTDWFRCLAAAHADSTTQGALLAGVLADLDAMRSYATFAERAIRKRHTILRLGLLAGPFFEFEQATVTADRVFGTDTTSVAVELAGQTFARFEIRPTFTIRDSFERVRFDLRPFFKFPLYDFDGCGSGDGACDFRIDATARLTFRLTDIGSNGAVSIAPVYTLAYDNDPPTLPASVIQDASAEGARFVDPSMPKTHHIFRFALVVGFD